MKPRQVSIKKRMRSAGNEISLRENKVEEKGKKK